MPATLERPKLTKRKYRVLVGTHIQPDPTIQPWNREVDPRIIDPKTGAPKITEWPQDRTYRAGEIVESEYDLCKLNARGGSPKFALLQEETERVHDDGYRAGYEAAMRELQGKMATNGIDAVQAAAERGAAGLKEPEGESTYDYMTLDELKKMAAEEDIDIGGLADRAAIIQRIKAANS